MSTATTTQPPRLIIVLGDQLWAENPALLAGDKTRDVVLMVECHGEAAHVLSHKARIALFFSAMRHFARDLKRAGWNVQYLQIGQHAHTQIADAMTSVIGDLNPVGVMMCEAGEWRVKEALRQASDAVHTPLKIIPDSSFLLTRHEFAEWAKQHKRLRMESFYRFMRARTGILMHEGQPVGGKWNHDLENRKSFPASGPGAVPLPATLTYDELTWHTLRDVRKYFPDSPGDLEEFPWPVTREEALLILNDFVEHRLPSFGIYQDAMWADQPFLYHSLLASALNMRLLDPREVIRAVERALETGNVELASAEGFIRQILGWREFVRGVYWLDMPGMSTANHFSHTLQLPRWFWTGETEMRCMRQTVRQSLQHGYAHHIQRLMIVGNFALLAGIAPEQVSDWFLGVYVDAVEWAALPNVVGVALYANGGRFTSKPYIASGAYIKRMSNYCEGCRYKPGLSTGPDACPFTTLFWHFLDRNEALLHTTERTSLLAKNLDRLSKEDRAAIRYDAIRKLGRLDKL